MKNKKTQLIASYWTLAGNTFPGAPSEVATFSLQDRVSAASKAGWSGLGFTYADLLHLEQTIGIREVANLLKEHGLEYAEVEFLTDWHLQGSKKQASDYKRKQLLEFAAAIGAQRLKCGAGVLEQGDLDVAGMRASFLALCEVAAEFSIDVAIEFMPFSKVSTIDKVMAVTQGLHDNAGMVIDSWHVAYGGMEMSEIAKIPAPLIKGVELSDAMFVMSDNLIEQSNHQRLLIGDGEIDICGFIHNVRQTGFDGLWGVEIISGIHRGLAVDQMAELAYQSAMQFFEPPYA